MKKDNIPPQIYERVENELLAGEDLLWVGLPGSRLKLQGVPQRARAAAVTLFTVCIGTGVTLLLARTGPRVLPLMALLMVLGLLIAFLVWQLNRLSRGTIYAVTDRRVLILHPGGRARSYGPQDLRGIERREKPDGSGDLIFNPGSESTIEAPVGFFGIEHVRQVEALLLETFRPGPDEAKSKHNPLYDDDSDEKGTAGWLRA